MVVVEELPPVESTKQTISDESAILNEDTEIPTNSVLNDSVMAVYGGKDETFMENSTLEQSVDMTADQGNESIVCNSVSNSSTQDTVKSETIPSQESPEVSIAEKAKASICNEEIDASAQDDTPVPIKAEELASDATVTDTKVEDSKDDVDSEKPSKEECDGTQGTATSSKGQTGGDKNDRGSKRHRDR